MRVIAGKYRSRTLGSMPGMEIRPTSDRLRETLFNVLCAASKSALAGVTFLDLFAGTGAVGIEALSRGAGNVVFVESSAKAVALIHENLKLLGVVEGYSVLRSDVTTALSRLEASGMMADLVFLDPPYAGHALYQGTLEALDRWSGVNSGSLVIAEHAKRFDPGETVGSLQRYRKLAQGDAALSLYRKG
jgi:16S rRNA (guanine(966)-N(2))-methyltransferase RsmD